MSREKFYKCRHAYSTFRCCAESVEFTVRREEPEVEDSVLAENHRLRALIKEAEMAAMDRDRCAECPWCGLGKPHAVDCKAFTPEGEVR